MKGVVISVLVVLAMVHLMVKPGEAAISCKHVGDLVAPCMGYITTGIGSPTKACCDGLDKLKNLSTTTAEKQQVCNCGKDSAAHLPPLNEKAVASLPAKCNIQADVPISNNINCQDIH